MTLSPTTVEVLKSKDETIASQAAEIQRLRGLLFELDRNTQPCENCAETGTEPETEDTCHMCGGYGFNLRGDYRETILDIRAELAKE